MLQAQHHPFLLMSSWKNKDWSRVNTEQHNIVALENFLQSIANENHNSGGEETEPTWLVVKKKHLGIQKTWQTQNQPCVCGWKTLNSLNYYHCLPQEQRWVKRLQPFILMHPTVNPLQSRQLGTTRVLRPSENLSRQFGPLLVRDTTKLRQNVVFVEFPVPTSLGRDRVTPLVPTIFYSGLNTR